MALGLCKEYEIETYSLLIVPNYKERCPLYENRSFVEVLKSLNKAEFILHGYSHQGSTPLHQYVWTSGEGEFSLANSKETLFKICQAQAEVSGLGLKCHFFVPPAWIGNAHLEETLINQGFKGIGYRFYIKFFNPSQRFFSPVIVLSNRRGLSYLSIKTTKFLFSLWRTFPVLRLALHCADFRDKRKIELWKETLEITKKERRFITYGELLSQSRSSPTL